MHHLMAELLLPQYGVPYAFAADLQPKEVMHSYARRSGQRSITSRVMHVACAGLLLAGWSVAAVTVATTAQASVVAEDPAPADDTADAPAEAPADTPATDTSREPDQSSNADPDPAEPATEDSADPAPDESSDVTGDEATDEASDQTTDDEATDDEATDETTDDEATDDEATDDEATDETTDEDASEIDPADSGEGAAAITLQINADVGAPAAGAAISVNASGLLPDSRAGLFVFSEPRLLATSTTSGAGELSLSATLPGDLEPGTHTVVLEAFDSNGDPVENATQIDIDADGLIAGITENASTEGLEIPELSADPMVPAFPVVVPLDNPEFVASKSVTALTLLTVAGVGLGAAVGATRSPNGTGSSGSGGGGTRGGGPDGGGIETAVRTRADDLDDANDWNAHRGARLSLALAGFSGILPRVSPLLSRIVSDAAPLRAFTGNLSFLLPLATLLLGIFAASSVGGLAEPAAAAFLLPLMVIGVFDALAGLIGALSFTVVVAVSGGLVNASSVRSVIGVGLVIAGPGIIASSFRDIRRKRAVGSAAAWERLTDLVVVPLIGAWTTIAIISALPDLGGLDFPIADQARLFGLVALVALVAKVLIEEAAARWVPARMSALSATNPAEPGTTQQVISALVRTSVFLFIAAAFVGNVWQLWVAAALFMLPGLLALIAHVFPNSPRLWQILPEGIPLFAVMLVIGLIVTSAVKSVQGDSPQFAQMSFLWMAVPGFLLALLGLAAREPREGDVRWYMRPAMTNVYRVGGIVVLVIAVALALRG